MDKLPGVFVHAVFEQLGHPAHHGISDPVIRFKQFCHQVPGQDNDVTGFGADRAKGRWKLTEQCGETETLAGFDLIQGQNPARVGPGVQADFSGHQHVHQMLGLILPNQYRVRFKNRLPGMGTDFFQNIVRQVLKKLYFF
jgi:hypothetical protein